MSKKKYTTVRIESSVAEKVKDFSEATGVPMGKVFADSARDWLETKGKGVLAAVNSQSEN